MTHRGPCQPLPFCDSDSVILILWVIQNRPTAQVLFLLFEHIWVPQGGRAGGVAGVSDSEGSGGSTHHPDCRATRQEQGLYVAALDKKLRFSFLLLEDILQNLKIKRPNLVRRGRHCCWHLHAPAWRWAGKPRQGGRSCAGTWGFRAAGQTPSKPKVLKIQSLRHSRDINFWGK